MTSTATTSPKPSASVGDLLLHSEDRRWSMSDPDSLATTASGLHRYTDLYRVTSADAIGFTARFERRVWEDDRPPFASTPTEMQALYSALGRGHWQPAIEGPDGTLWTISEFADGLSMATSPEDEDCAWTLPDETTCWDRDALRAGIQAFHAAYGEPMSAEKPEQADRFGIADEDDILYTIPGPALRALLRIAHDTLDGMSGDEMEDLDIAPDYREILCRDARNILGLIEPQRA